MGARCPMTRNEEALTRTVEQTRVRATNKENDT